MTPRRTSNTTSLCGDAIPRRPPPRREEEGPCRPWRCPGFAWQRPSAVARVEEVRERLSMTATVASRSSDAGGPKLFCVPQVLLLIIYCHSNRLPICQCSSLRFFIGVKLIQQRSFLIQLRCCFCNTFSFLIWYGFTINIIGLLRISWQSSQVLHSYFLNFLCFSKFLTR